MEIHITDNQEWFEVHVEDSEKIYFSKSFNTKEKAEIFANGVLAGLSIFIDAKNPIKIIRGEFVFDD